MYIGNNEFNMIGFGIKIEIPCFDIIELSERLKYLLGIRKTEIIPKPKLNCDILSDKKALKKLFTQKGKHKIDIMGNYTISSDAICIRSWSPRVTFKSIYNKIDNYKGYGLFSKGDVSYADLSTEETGTLIRLEVNRQKNKNEIFDKLKEAVSESLKASLTYHVYAVDVLTKKVHEISIDEYLLSCYKYYEMAVDKYKNVRLSELRNELEEINRLKKINKFIKDIRFDNYEKDIKYLSDNTNINESELNKLLNKYKISKLFNLNEEENKIHEKIEEVERLSVNTELNNLK